MSQKKRNKQFWKEKLLIRCRMKDAEIHKAISNQSWIELEVPIHDGYYAEYILRDDILRREDSASYQEALDACMKKIWGRTPEFKFKNKKTKRWENINPKLTDINKEAYEKLSPQAKKFYYEAPISSKRRWRYGYSDKWYACSLSYELVVKVTKSFITHRREHDGVLYQMDAENEKIMHQIAGNGNPWGYDRDYGSWYYKYENRKEKLRAGREVVEIVKKYKGSDETKLIKKVRELE